MGDFTIDFRTLATDSGWDTQALITTFHHGLSVAIKDELASCDLGGDLEPQITMPIRIDNCIFEQVKQRHLDTEPVSQFPEPTEPVS